MYASTQVCVCILECRNMKKMFTETTLQKDLIERQPRVGYQLHLTHLLLVLRTKDCIFNVTSAVPTFVVKYFLNHLGMFTMYSGTQ